MMNITVETVLTSTRKQREDWLKSCNLDNRKIDLHIHSNFSDGCNSPEEIVKRAIQLGYKEIAIVDHVRRSSNWVNKFVAEMGRLKQLYSGEIKLHSGIEAKVINLNGDVDARLEFFAKVDLVLGAFHRIPKGGDEYLSNYEISSNMDKALSYWFTTKMKLLENPDVDIIAHSTAILKRNGIIIPTIMKQAIAQKAALFEKTFEVNSKYQLPDREFLHFLQINKVKLSFGSDSHSIDEI